MWMVSQIVLILISTNEFIQSIQGFFNRLLCTWHDRKPPTMSLVIGNENGTWSRIPLRLYEGTKEGHACNRGGIKGEREGCEMRYWGHDYPKPIIVCLQVLTGPLGPRQ